MERFEEFARKVFSKKKPSTSREAVFPAPEPADDAPPEPPAKDAD
jgi:hypothetical protein